MQAPLREEIAEFYDSLDPESLEQVIDGLMQQKECCLEIVPALKTEEQTK